SRNLIEVLHYRSVEKVGGTQPNRWPLILDDKLNSECSEAATAPQSTRFARERHCIQGARHLLPITLLPDGDDFPRQFDRGQQIRHALIVCFGVGENAPARYVPQRTRRRLLGAGELAQESWRLEMVDPGSPFRIAHTDDDVLLVSRAIARKGEQATEVPPLD